MTIGVPQGSVFVTSFLHKGLENPALFLTVWHYFCLEHTYQLCFSVAYVKQLENRQL